MLDRVPVNIIDVPLEIPVVANQVFPVSALPDAALASFYAARGPSLTGRYGARKPGFDQSPAGLVVRIAGRQSPNAVQVFGQDDHRIDFEGMLALNLAEDLPVVNR